MGRQGATAEFVEEDQTYYLTGPQVRDFINFAATTVVIVGIVQAVTMVTDSQIIIVLVASFLTIGQTTWLLKDSEKNPFVAAPLQEAPGKVPDANVHSWPATSILSNIGKRRFAPKDKNV